jgi:GxxExxY protein
MSDITSFPDLGARLTQKIIGAGIKVHQALGPGLLENVYEECLAIQFQKDGVAFERQKILPVVYDGVQLDLSYKADFIIENQIILELKAVEKVLPIHEAQLLTYMKLSKKNLGLLLNFNTVLLKDGIKRLALSER